jgi:hypothetical protein
MISALTIARAAGFLSHPAPPAGPGELPITFAFWFAVIAIASAIWKGFEVAGRVTLEILKWSVLQLWSFARTVAKAAKEIGIDLVKGARKTWDFFEDTYEHVIKPAWNKFYAWYRRAREWLERVIGPVYKFLERLRGELRKLYDRWVRPILDSIDIARRVLGVLRSFGWDWVVRLDGYLTNLQERIDQPFRYALAKLNEVINLVNRVITFNGLIQRVALIRSIERDIRLVNRAFLNWRLNPASADQYAAHVRKSGRTEAEIWREFIETVEPGGAARDSQAAEIAADWRITIERR